MPDKSSLPSRLCGIARELPGWSTIALRALLGGHSEVGYVGCVGTHNIGDAIMLPLFRDQLGGSRLQPSLGFRGVEHRLWSMVCRRSMRACVLGGGTLIFGDHYYEYLARALDAGVPCHVIGSGVRSPEFWEQYGPDRIYSPERWVQALQSCAFVGVRGPHSRQLLLEAGFEGAEVIGDPALLLASESAQVPSGEKLLGVNFGTSYDLVWGGDEAGAMCRLAAAVREMLNAGWRARLYCVWPCDREAVASLAREIGSDKVETVEILTSAREYLDDVVRCSVFVGMKLHAVALALCAGVPAVMLEYRPKCRDFMASLALDGYSVRIDRLEPSRLAGTLQALPASRSEYLGVCRDPALVLKRELRRTFASVGECSLG